MGIPKAVLWRKGSRGRVYLDSFIHLEIMHSVGSVLGAYALVLTGNVGLFDKHLLMRVVRWSIDFVSCFSRILQRRLGLPSKMLPVDFGNSWLREGWLPLVTRPEEGHLYA